MECCDSWCNSDGTAFRFRTNESEALCREKLRWIWILLVVTSLTVSC